MLDFLNKSKREKVFWEWFISRKNELEGFIDSDHSNKFPYHRLIRKMTAYSKNVFAELGKTRDEKYLLVLTADGNPEGLKPINKLFYEKPEIENWEVVKFRQPRDELQIELEGISFPLTDIQLLYSLDQDNEKVHIEAYIPDYDSDRKKYQAIAWLYLDHILGEFNSMTKLGHVQFKNLNQEIPDSVNIIELRKIIESELYGVRT